MEISLTFLPFHESISQSAALVAVIVLILGLDGPILTIWNLSRRMQLTKTSNLVPLMLSL